MWLGSSFGPGGGYVVTGAGGYGGEVVAVGLEGVLGVVVVDGLAGVGLVLGYAVEVDDAVAEVDVVAGNADGALDEEEVWGLGVGFQEDDDVAAADFTVVDEWRPFCGWSEGDAVDEDVVADEEGLDHRGGGDLEVLEDEGHDEEAYGEDGADGGEGFERGFVLLLLLLCFSFDLEFGCFRVHPSLRVSGLVDFSKCIAEWCWRCGGTPTLGVFAQILHSIRLRSGPRLQSLDFKER